jgi:hypothetical protein
MDGYPLNELFKCLAFISTGLAAVWLLLYSSGRCLRRLRVRQEYAAALVLMRAPSAMRDALCACRTHIVEAGEAPPATGAHSTRRLQSKPQSEPLRHRSFASTGRKAS